MKKHFLIAASYLLCFGLGFWLGRQTINVRESIRYVEGKSYSIYLPNIMPKYERLADNIKLIDIDNTLAYFKDSTDLMPTVIDWNKERTYSEVLFNNEYGKLSLDGMIQYNRVQWLKPTFVPLQKEITLYRERTWTPFVMASYSTIGYERIGGGLFYHDIGISAGFVRDFNTNKNGVEAGLIIKF